jgi:hypothetical protein
MMAGHAAEVLTHCAIKRMCGMGGGVGGGDIIYAQGRTNVRDLLVF